MIVAAVLALIAGGGVVYASADALPGDALCAVKRGVEGGRLALVVGDEGKAQAYLELAAERVTEVQRARASGRTAAVAEAATAFADDVAAADDHLTRAAASGRDVAALGARLAALTEAVAASEQGPATASARVKATREGGQPGAPRTHPAASAAAGGPETTPIPGAVETGVPGRPTGTPGGGRSSLPEQASALAEAAGAGDAARVRELAGQLAASVEDETARVDAADAGARGDVAARLVANLERLQTELAEVADSVPVEAQPALARVLELTRRGLERAQRATGERRPTATPSAAAAQTPEARPVRHAGVPTPAVDEPGSVGRPTAIPAAPPAVRPTRKPEREVVPPAAPTPRPDVGQGAGDRGAGPAAPARSGPPASQQSPAPPAPARSGPPASQQSPAPPAPPPVPAPSRGRS